MAGQSVEEIFQRHLGAGFLGKFPGFLRALFAQDAGGLLVLQARGSAVVGAGVAASGALLLVSLGVGLIEQPWLLVALAIYALDLVLAFAIQRPNLRRLLSGGPGDDATWRARARRQRYMSYLMAGMVGAIGWLMSAKPVLW